MFFQKNINFLCGCITKAVLVGIWGLCFFQVEVLKASDSGTQEGRVLDETICKEAFIVDKKNPSFDLIGRQFRVEKLGLSQAYSLDFTSLDDIWSGSLKINGVVDSKAFWKDVLFFSSEVMSIYRARKAHLGYYFLSNWAIDVQKNPYDSTLVTVYKNGEDGLDAVVGTVRFIVSDARGKLPMEKFLNIGLKTDGFEKYEIGLLTVEKILSVKERQRILLELWLHLVEFFKERNKEQIRIYVFADKFCTKIYTTWGFEFIPYFYKDGDLVVNDSKNKDLLKLEQGPNMEVLTYVLSKENLIRLLDKATLGALSIDSKIVQDRLEQVGLGHVFDLN